jgi:crotonobetainyl-CoA:carnitine CoA-transferase CaiB-like acyl-CoA transferase
MTTALEGLQVLDFTWGLPGAIATMVLGDNGADVIKVEPPGGDPQRDMPAFAQWHRGKRSVVLDLKHDDDRARARELALTADVLVQSWRPGVAERLGLDYAALAGDNPGLVHCSITGFGPHGPAASLRGYDGIVAAKAGLLAGGDRPRYSAILGASFAASQGALQGILAALYVRGNTGKGQEVATSLVQALTGYELYNWLGPQLTGAQAEQRRGGSTYSQLMGMIGFTQDGHWLQFANFRPHLLAAFLHATELEDWYREAMTSGEKPEVISETVLRRLHEKTLDEWMEIFLASEDIGVEPYRTPLEAMDHPQMIHNGHVIEVVDPALGKTRQVGPMVRLDRTPAEPKEGAPALGEHPEATFAARAPLPASAALPTAPLAGVTVVELAWFYAAPFGTALLADLGARVIKVESADGDPHRYQNPMREFSGVKALQGKESIVVDYRTPEGREILHQLVARADIVMRNYRQQNSVLTGDDYTSLEPVNPDQVYLYAGAYGSDGPYTLRPAFAPTMGVAAGHRAYQLGWPSALRHSEALSFEEGMERMRAQRTNSGGPTANADAAAAMVVGSAMLLGLIAKQRSGTGQYLETSMLCSNAYVVSDDFLDYDGKSVESHHDENGVNALYRLYPAAEGWVFLAAPLASDWPRLATALRTGADGTSADGDAAVDISADDRFATPEQRVEHDAALAEAIGAVLATRGAAEWETAFAAHDVALAEVNQGSFSEFTISSDVVRDNGFVAEVTHPLFGRHLRHAPIVTFSETPGEARPACLVGQHTRAILRELGYGDDAALALRERGIVGWSDDAG